MTDGLSFDDAFNLGRLKRLRDRSLRQPRWRRDADQVLRYLTFNVVPSDGSTWPSGSGLTPEIEAAARALRKARRGGDPEWQDAFAAIDLLIDRAEEIHGRPLPDYR